MKIKTVRGLPLFCKAKADMWSSRFSPEENLNTLIEIVTDEGLSGLGSAFTSGELVAGSLKLLRPLLIGASPLGPSALTERLHQLTFWQGRGGAITHTLSGIDIALWDLFGKAAGQSVSRLLGGRHREKIKAYGSLLMAEPEIMRERLSEGLARGFQAFKIGWGPFGRRDAKTDEAIVAAARETVGPDVELMVDAGGSDRFWPHGFKWALHAARMLSAHDVAWFEEPLRPDDLDGYVRLTQEAPLPISAGEVLTRRQSFLPWIEQRAVDYLQPDVTKVGGLSEQRRIAQYADDHSILTVPHGWNTAVGLAADLQWAAAAGNARWVEYKTPEPFLEDLFLEAPALDPEGRLAIPDAPGLGFAWNPEGVAKHAKGLTLTPGAR